MQVQVFLCDGRGTRDTCILHVSVYIMSANIPLTKASHMIEFKVNGWGGVLIPWIWEKEVDIFEQESNLSHQSKYIISVLKT